MGAKIWSLHICGEIFRMEKQSVFLLNNSPKWPVYGQSQTEIEESKMVAFDTVSEWGTDLRLAFS